MSSDENSSATLRQLIEMINTKVSETVEAVEGVRSILTGKDGQNGLMSRVARNEEKIRAIETGRKWNFDVFGMVVATALGTALASLILWLLIRKT